MTQRKQTSLLLLCASVCSIATFAVWTAVIASVIESPTAALMQWPQFSHAAAPSIVGNATSDSREDRSYDERDRWEIEKGYTLRIPSLHLRAPVQIPSRTHWDHQDWELLERQMQIAMRWGVVAYPHSRLPGEHGSIYLAGHSSPPSSSSTASQYGRIFEDLPSIAIGEEILLIDTNRTIRYRVRETSIVASTATDILGDRTTNALLLITCYPVGTTQDRFVVEAEQIEVIER